MNSVMAKKMTMTEKEESRFRFLIPLLAIFGLIVFGQIVRQYLGIDLFSSEGIQAFRSRLISLGAWMPLALLCIYSLRSIMYFPEGIYIVTIGFLVGPYLGLALVFLGSLAAGTISYGWGVLLRRFGGDNVVNRMMRGNLRAFEEKTARFGYQTLFVLRCMPIFPFSMITICAGLLKIPFPRYLFAMGVGVLVPGIFYLLIGQSLLLLLKTSTGWHSLAVALLALGGLLGLGYWFLRKLPRKN